MIYNMFAKFRSKSALSPLRSMLALLLIGLMSSHACAQAANERVSEAYENAVKSFNNAQYEEAVIYLKNALQENPRFLPALVMLGEASLQTGDPAAAEVALSDAIELGADPAQITILHAQSLLAQFKHDRLIDTAEPSNLPDDTMAALLLVKARAALEVNRISDAERIVSRIEQYDARAQGLLSLRSALALRRGNYDQAQDLVSRLLDIYPNSADTWLNSASLKHARGDLTGALDDYSRVIELAPDNTAARIARIGVLLDLNRDRQTAEDFTALTKSSGLDPRVSYLRAVRLARAGDTLGSSQALNDALNVIEVLGDEVVTRNMQLLLVAGTANYTLGHLELARSYLDAYTKIDSGALGPRRMLASVYMKLGDNSGAINMLRSLALEYPGNRDLLVQLAESYRAAGNFEQSVITLEQIISETEGDFELESGLAVSRLGAGYIEQGVADLEKLFNQENNRQQVGFTLAVTLLNQGKPEEASRIAQQLVADSPQDNSYASVLAIAQATLGNAERAKQLFEQILERAPDYFPARINLAKIDLNRGNYSAARARLDALQKDMPGNAQVMLTKARLEYVQGNSKEALRWARSAANAAPQSFSMQKSLVEYLISAQLSDEALELAKSQAALYPGNLFARELELAVLKARGDTANAKSRIDEMIELAGFNSEWLTKLAEHQLAIGDNDGANYTLFKALQGNASNRRAKQLQIESELKLGRLEQAKEHAKAMISDYPDSAEGYALLGKTYLQSADYAPAINQFEQAFRLEPKNITLLNLYLAKRAANQLADGQKLLRDWLKQNPNDLEVKNALAEHYLGTGKYQEAVNLYSELVKEIQSQPMLHNNLANALFKLNRTQEAIEHARVAQQLKKNDPLINDTLGWLLVSQGQYSEGIAYLREAVTRASANAEIRYHLAVALHGLQRTDEARSELTQALSTGSVFDGRKEAEAMLERLDR